MTKAERVLMSMMFGSILSLPLFAVASLPILLLTAPLGVAMVGLPFSLGLWLLSCWFVREMKEYSRT